MPKFDFIPEGHRYLLDGNDMVSVTQCLPKSPHMKTDAYYGDKGTYVHAMCRMYLLNDLDEDTLDPALVPYLNALKKFLKDSQGMGIVGCFDIKSGAHTPCVELQIPAYIELANNGIANDFGKIAEYPQRLFLETPMYHPLYGYCGTPDIVMGPFPIREGHALYLKDNGKYSLRPVKDVRKNFEQFIHQLESYKWKKERGLL